MCSRYYKLLIYYLLTNQILALKLAFICFLNFIISEDMHKGVPQEYVI